MKNLLILFVLSFLLLGGGWYLADRYMNKDVYAPMQENLESESENSETTENNELPENNRTLEIIAENLTIPWEIAFLNDNSLLVTERDGNLTRIYPDRTEQIQIEGVEHVGEGGLLGLALHPNYPQNNLIYLYLTTRTDAGLINRVEQYLFNEEENTLEKQQTIIDNIPGATYHDGGRIMFGPDNLLYITTGDAGNENLAQNTDSLAGKILRLNPDGSIPNNNPFNNEVYSYGHRNPQGLAWDENNNLWSSEHGPSGIGSGFDEVNLIDPASNYGWPVIQGDEEQEDMITPKIQSGANETWAPASLEYLQGYLFFGGLRGETLYKVEITQDNNLNNLERLYQNEFGRIRAVKLSPDNNWIYITTSNRDGRGNIMPGDDKIIRIPVDNIL